MGNAMDRVFLPVLVMMFVGVICFMIGNTTMSYIVPVFNSTASSMHMNMTTYTQQSSMIANCFYLAGFIIIATPIAYLFLRVFKKEPQPQEYQGGFY
jgi:type II secretory pathway component PulF